MKQTDKDMCFINIYLPYENTENVDSYIESLAKIDTFVNEICNSSVGPYYRGH